MTPRLEDPLDLGGVTVRNRLYRAPVLEVVGTGPDRARRLTRDFEPSAAAGVGLIFQGANIVTATGGRTAPALQRAHDREFVLGWKPTVDAVHAHGARLFMQIGHGGLQCMELWHREYREAHPDVETLAVAEPPWWFRALGWTPFLDLATVRVASADELEALADAFGRAAANARAAGYDGVHLAGANSSIFQQFWSPVFNRRSDDFGGDTVRDRSRFIGLVVDAIRRHAGNDYPVTTKVPAEASAPFFVRRRLTIADGVEIARVCEDLGIAAVAPVQVGVTRDQSVARGHFPRIAWFDPRWQKGYDRVFGSAVRKRLVRFANRLAARLLPPTPMWNATFARKVKARVDVPVLLEGGVRTRHEIDTALADGTADMLGMARPFYAEPRVPYRVLHEHDAQALCASCNNCTIPQITGALGVCRTPNILQARGVLMKRGAYGDER